MSSIGEFELDRRNHQPNEFHSDSILTLTQSIGVDGTMNKVKELINYSTTVNGKSLESQVASMALKVTGHIHIRLRT